MCLIFIDIFPHKSDDVREIFMKLIATDKDEKNSFEWQSGVKFNLKLFNINSKRFKTQSIFQVVEGKVIKLLQ